MATRSKRPRRGPTPVDKAVRKYGIKTLRRRTHPQQWRAGKITGARKKLTGPGARLGPLKELGDDVIIEVKYNSFRFDQFAAQLKTVGVPRSVFSVKAVWRLLRLEVYEPLQAYLDDKIDTWVPMDTGDLRESLHNALEPGESKININDWRRGLFRVILNTEGIPYAGPVNNMPTSWLRHPGKHGRTKASLHGYLYDPQARKGWYNLLLVNGRNRAKRLYSIFMKKLKDAIMNTQAGAVYTRRQLDLQMRSIFSVRFR